MRIWGVFAAMLLMAGFAFAAPVEDIPAEPVREAYDRAVVLEVINVPSEKPGCKPGQKDKSRKTDEASGFNLPVHIGDVQKVRLRIDSGRLGGREFVVDNIIEDNPAMNVPVSIGSRVIVSIDSFPDGTDQVYLADRERSPVISALLAAFLLLLLWVGGRKPARHFFIAVGTILLALNVRVPAMLVWSGTSVLAALLALIFVVAAGHYLLYPQCRVPYAVFVFSTYSCMMLLMFIMLGVAWLSPLNGFFDESASSLWVMSRQFDFDGLLHTCAMLTGLGFVFYLACGMTQDVSDFIHDDMDLDNLKSRLMESGRERLGPLLAMQWLVMAGGWFPLAIQTMDADWMKFLNMESVATVMAFVLVVSLTLVASVPLMATLVPWLIAEDRKKRQAKPSGF